MSETPTTSNPKPTRRHRPPALWVIALLTITLLAAACGSDEVSVSAGDSGDKAETHSERDNGRRRPPGAALDAHTHVMSPELTAGLAGPDVPASTADDLIGVLDEANVKRAVVLSLAYFTELPNQAAVEAENDYAAAEVAKYPDRLIGFCGINPLRPADIDEIDRCIDELGMTGVKLHLEAVDIDLNRPEHVAAVSAIFDKLAEREVPVMMHPPAESGTGQATFALAGIIAEHPTVPLTFAHCTHAIEGDQIEVWLRGIRQGLFNVDNLFLDTSACLNIYEDAPPSQKELIVWRLRTWGIDRVLFGSDYLRIQPDATPAEALETLRSYPFTRQEIRTIMTNDGSAWLDATG